jgi:hypothetical protein
VLLLIGSAPVDAQTISINVVGGGFVSGTPAPLDPGNRAGVVAVDNWNNVADNVAVGSVGALLDDDGVPTSAAISWSAPNTWSNQITAIDPNSRMMKGYLDFGSVITVTGVPYALYDVYVYFKSDNATVAGTVGMFTIAAETKYGANTGLVPASGEIGAFVEADGSYVGDPAAIGNYVVFRGLSSSDFTLDAAPAIYTSAVTGIQVTAHPPAVTFSSTLDRIAALLATGGIGNAGVASALSEQILNASAATGRARTNILRAFINYVNAQTGIHITPLAASALLADATSLLDVN